MTKIEEYLQKANNHFNGMDFEYFKENIFNHTLKWEGNDNLHKVSGDSGGWTLWGIAYNYNSKLFRNFDDFKDTTYEEAAAIAFCKYYLPIKAHLLTNKHVALMYFDMAYNMGTSRAKKIIQKCAGVKADGIIGPKTLSRFEAVTVYCLYKERQGFYNRLVIKKQHLGKFLRGWINRLNYMFKQKL